MLLVAVFVFFKSRGKFTSIGTRVSLGLVAERVNGLILLRNQRFRLESLVATWELHVSCRDNLRPLFALSRAGMLRIPSEFQRKLFPYRRFQNPHSSSLSTWFFRINLEAVVALLRVHRLIAKLSTKERTLLGTMVFLRFFLTPVALVVCEISSMWPHLRGGVYDWANEAFGA